jgi:hypothetical protein
MRVAYFTFWGSIGPRILDWLATSTNDEVVAVVSRPGEQGDLIKGTVSDVNCFSGLATIRSPGGWCGVGFGVEVEGLG